MKIRSKVGLAATAAGLVATAALATGSARASISNAETRSIAVRYDPRDLNTDKGAEHLLSRVSGAASRVCNPGGSMLQPIESSGYRNCRHDAIARAVADINRPTVTAAYNRHFAERDRALRCGWPQPTSGAGIGAAADTANEGGKTREPGLIAAGLSSYRHRDHAVAATSEC